MLDDIRLSRSKTPIKWQVSDKFGPAYYVGTYWNIRFTLWSLWDKMSGQNICGHSLRIRSAPHRHRSKNARATKYPSLVGLISGSSQWKQKDKTDDCTIQFKTWWWPWGYEALFMTFPKSIWKNNIWCVVKRWHFEMFWKVLSSKTIWFDMDLHSCPLLRPLTDS